MPGAGEQPHPVPGQSHHPGRASRPVHLTLPRPSHPPLPTLLPNWPQGLGRPAGHKEKDPSRWPLLPLCPEGPAILSLEPLVPLSVRPSVLRAPPQGDRLGTKAWAALRERRGIWKLLSQGGVGEGPHGGDLAAPPAPGVRRTEPARYLLCMVLRIPRPAPGVAHGGACMADIPGSVSLRSRPPLEEIKKSFKKFHVS